MYFGVLPIDNMPRSDSKYRNVGLPEPLVVRIKKFITDNPDKGFISVSDFVRHAAIDKLDYYANTGEN